MNFFTYNAPFGPMTVASNGQAITNVALQAVTFKGKCAPDKITNVCATQLMEYFSGKRSVFSVPIELSGTQFQLEIWQVIEHIPYGQTRTPTDIALQIGKPESYRLVSKAAYANPVAVIVPAHRVVAASGQESDSSRAAKLREALREFERLHM